MRTAERALSTPRTSVAAARSPCGGPAGTYERRLTYRDPMIGRGLALSALVWLGWLAGLAGAATVERRSRLVRGPGETSGIRS